MFQHLDKVDAGRIDEFQANPRAYLAKYGPALGWRSTLSDRQALLLDGRSALAGELKRVVLGNNDHWIPGAVTVIAVGRAAETEFEVALDELLDAELPGYELHGNCAGTDCPKL